MPFRQKKLICRTCVCASGLTFSGSKMIYGTCISAGGLDIKYCKNVSQKSFAAKSRFQENSLMIIRQQKRQHEINKHEVYKTGKTVFSLLWLHYYSRAAPPCERLKFSHLMSHSICPFPHRAASKNFFGIHPHRLPGHIAVTQSN